MKKIKLFKTSRGWQAQFIDDVEVFKLFGTTILPTAYGASIDGDKVRELIQSKNPGCLVEVL